MAMTMTFLSGLFALVIWINAKSYGVLIFYAIVGGGVAGTFWGTVAPVTTEVVGLQNLPPALALTWLNLVLPTTFSEPIALEIVERGSSGYLGAQLFAGLMYIAAALCLLTVRIWKIAEDQRVEAEKRQSSEEPGSPSGIAGEHAQASVLSRIFSLRKV